MITNSKFTSNLEFSSSWTLFQEVYSRLWNQKQQHSGNCCVGHELAQSQCPLKLLSPLKSTDRQ